MNDETWKMGSTAAPAVAIGALADGILGWFACVSVCFRVRRGGAPNSAGRARSPIHPRFGENCVR